MSPILVVGSHNRKKAAELAHLFGRLPLELKTLADFPQTRDVVEDGDSFAANARLKGDQQARHLGQWVLGEDSGLCVDALGGAPGIYSARYAATASDAVPKSDAASTKYDGDEANNECLLFELARLDHPQPLTLAQRSAHYVCHMVLCDPTGTVRAESEGICRGRIRREPAGTSGFGYDPLFEVAEYHQTFGQLGDLVKAALSHRSRAARILLGQLTTLLNHDHWHPICS